MTRRIVHVALLAVVAAMPFSLAIEGRAADRQALLQDGKKTLFERVLTRPGASLRAKAGDTAEAGSIAAFTPLYVFGHAEVGGENWLEIGPRTPGEPAGWVEEKATVPWRQAITVAFANQAQRERALIYDGLPGIRKVVDAESPAAVVDGQRKGLAAGKVAGVVAEEPETRVDIRENFYMLPVLDFTEGTLPDGMDVNLLQIAAVSAKGDGDKPIREISVEDRLKGFRSGIVFVVDTTQSMQPWIDRVRAVVKAVLDRVKGSPFAKQTGFAFVGFRDNTSAAPGLDYTSKIFVDLPQEPSADEMAHFLKETEKAKAATVSSKGFVEDPFAGLKTALDQVNWGPYHGRYIVLVTDAGARDADDPLSTTGLTPASINAYAVADGKRVAITVFHLLTQAGRANHEAAEAQYRSVGRFDSNQLYWRVNAASPDQFQIELDSFVDTLLGQIGQSADAFARAPRPEDRGARDPKKEAVLDVGRAMVLAYLGEMSGEAVPEMFSGWIGDRDVAHPTVKAVEPLILLNRNQLNDLRATVRELIEAASGNRLSSEAFIMQLRSAMASLGRNPDTVVAEKARKLADMGVLGEYLEGLPYKSQAMNMDPRSWADRSPAEQASIIANWRSQLRAYEGIYDDQSRWFTMDVSRVKGEEVTPIPLTLLP